MKKHTTLIVSLAPIVSLTTLNAMDAEKVEVQKVQSYQETDVYIEEDDVENQDIWFGPGFYYGIWFDNEPDYWGWRDEHWDYPPNHNYYNHDHPIEYHHGDEEFHGAPRGGEEYRGGGHGGGHGGGGHR